MHVSMTRHGQATPLVWLTVDTAALKTVASATSIRSWCAWLKSCPPRSAPRGDAHSQGRAGVLATQRLARLSKSVVSEVPNFLT
jgi:hypothetical protein